MFSIVVGNYTLVWHDGLPQLYGRYVQHARLVDEFDHDQRDKCVLAIQHELDWPTLVVTQSCTLTGGFALGVLLVPETRLVFVGVNTRLLAYELSGPSRLWEDYTDCGFWAWARYDQYIIMSAELELAAWNLHGQKLWTTYVEPPWEYRVEDGTIYLDVMGELTRFPLDTGPPR